MSPLPVPPRPLKLATNAEIHYELAMRRGPRWRCSGCGWLCPEIRYQPRVPGCPVCREAGRPDTFPQRFTGSLQAGDIDGPDRTWLLAVADRCGLAWGDACTEPEADHCPHCLAPEREDYPPLWSCGSMRGQRHRAPLCYERHIEQLTAREGTTP